MREVRQGPEPLRDPCESPAASALKRACVLEEAKSWLTTPYHHMGRVKGAGCDCLTLLAEVYARAGVVSGPVEVPFYRPDVMLHRGEETYLEGLLGYGREVPAAEPGDAVLFGWGRIFGHAGIVTAWPAIIHACAIRGKVCEGDATQGRLRGRPTKFVSPF